MFVPTAEKYLRVTMFWNCIMSSSWIQYHKNIDALLRMDLAFTIEIIDIVIGCKTDFNRIIGHYSYKFAIRIINNSYRWLINGCIYYTTFYTFCTNLSFSICTHSSFNEFLVDSSDNRLSKFTELCFHG